MDGLTTLPPSTLSPRGVTALLRLIPWSPNTVCQPLPLRPLELLSLHAAAPRDSTWSSSYYGQEMSSRSPHHSLDINELSRKRRSVLNCTIPRSLSHSLDEKMLKALSLFVQLSGSGEGILAQVWTPIKTGDQYMLSTCGQAYLVDPRLSQYREVSRKLTFASKPNQCSYPGRVFIFGLREWTSNVMYYKKDEYLRDKHAIDNGKFHLYIIKVRWRRLQS